jgi:hypothetical protein
MSALRALSRTLVVEEPGLRRFAYGLDRALALVDPVRQEA